MEEDLGRELDVAVRVVHLACSLCQRVQRSLIFSAGDQVKSKDDDSLVTVADFGVQAVVSWILSESFGSKNVSIVAEEDTQMLSKAKSSGLLDDVANTVNECLSDASRFGLKRPIHPLGHSEILEAINRCNSSGGPVGRHWVLDPVDGTLGFVRGNQYAVALALLEEGKVVLGVLGCPNYPVSKEQLNHHHQPPTSQPSPNPSNTWERGCVMYARRGTGKAWMQPLLVEPKQTLDWVKSASLIRVSSIEDPSLATFCEPVEKANTSHSFTKGVVESVGLRKLAYRKVSCQHLLSRGLVAHNLLVSWDKGMVCRHLTLLRPCYERDIQNGDDEVLMYLLPYLIGRKQPMRVYSMVKYAAIARGDAEVYMKFASSGYREKIWDHAAGVLIVQEAGGVVTDAGGRPLDFSKGVFLEGLDRGIITCSGSILHEKIIGAVYASWESSHL